MTFRAPTVPPSAVRRGRLTHLFEQSLDRRLTLAVAPAGFGKTFLVAQWAISLQHDRVRWLNITRAHDDPDCFSADLGRAAGGFGPETGNAVLVLDDFHRL